MDINTLQRNARIVHTALQEVENTLVAVKPCKIYFPEHYLDGDLGVMEDTIKVIGIYAITVDDAWYGVSKACALIQTDPSIINIVTINGNRYYELIYNIGDKVITNLNLVRTGTLVYRIYNEFITNGKIPWYFSYSDLAFLFDTALLHGNANLRTDSALLELIASSMARQKENKFEFFRLDKRLQEPTGSILSPVYIPLKSVAFGATNTMAKLMGNYFSEGVTSALTRPTNTVESIEELIRG